MLFVQGVCSKCESGSGRPTRLGGSSAGYGRTSLAPPGDRALVTPLWRRASPHVPAIAIGALVHLESGPGFTPALLGRAEGVGTGRVPGLGLPISSPVGRVESELAMGWAAGGHQPSLAQADSRSCVGAQTRP